MAAARSAHHQHCCKLRSLLRADLNTTHQCHNSIGTDSGQVYLGGMEYDLGALVCLDATMLIPSWPLGGGGAEHMVR